MGGVAYTCVENGGTIQYVLVSSCFSGCGRATLILIAPETREGFLPNIRCSIRFYRTLAARLYADQGPFRGRGDLLLVPSLDVPAEERRVSSPLLQPD